MKQFRHTTTSRENLRAFERDANPIPEKSRGYRYRVEGQLYTIGEICERVPHIKQVVLARRVSNRFESTWEEIGRPLGTTTAKNKERQDAGRKKGLLRRSKKYDITKAKN